MDDSRNGKKFVKKAIESTTDIEKLYANGTSKEDVLSKLKELCYHSEYVKVARGYCFSKKQGKYYCNKKWKCNRKKQFCRGSVHHTCVYSKRQDETGKETNVTIGIFLEKVNKTKEAKKDLDIADTIVMTDKSKEQNEMIMKDPEHSHELEEVSFKI